MALWAQSKSKLLQKGKVAYNDCIRLLFRFTRELSVTEFCLSNTFLDFNAVRRKACCSLFRRLSLSDNLLVNKTKYNSRQKTFVNVIKRFCFIKLFFFALSHSRNFCTSKYLWIIEYSWAHWPMARLTLTSKNSNFSNFQ